MLVHSQLQFTLSRSKSKVPAFVLSSMSVLWVGPSKGMLFGLPVQVFLAENVLSVRKGVTLYNTHHMHTFI